MQPQVFMIIIPMACYLMSRMDNIPPQYYFHDAKIFLNFIFLRTKDKLKGIIVYITRDIANIKSPIPEGGLVLE